MSKKNRNKNKKKPKSQYQQRYEKGVQDGIARGTTFFLDKFEEFSKKEGIGFSTMKKLIDTVGEQYFEEWIKKNAPKGYYDKKKKEGGKNEYLGK